LIAAIARSRSSTPEIAKKHVWSTVFVRPARPASRAILPASIESIQIANLRVGEASVDLLLDRHPQDVGVTVLRRTGEVDIVTLK
jgi:hypothetical protein